MGSSSSPQELSVVEAQKIIDSQRETIRVLQGLVEYYCEALDRAEKACRGVDRWAGVYEAPPPIDMKGGGHGK